MTKLIKTAAKRPATRANATVKSAVATPLAKSAATKKPPTPVTRAPVRAKSKPEVSPEQRRCYVEVAAYFIAERHGFTPGRDAEDWAAAEAEIERMIVDGMLRAE